MDSKIGADMVRRRALVAGAGLALMAPLAGCTEAFGQDGRDVVDGSRDSDSVGECIPTPTSVDRYEGQLRDGEYTIWSVDAPALGAWRDSVSDVERGLLDSRIPLRHGLTHEAVGVEHDDVHERIFVGVTRKGSFPVGIDHVGMLAATITVGDFDSEVVTTQLEERFERVDEDTVVRFRDGGEATQFEEIGYAVDDGWLLAGFDPIVRAIVKARRGDVDRHVEDDPAVGKTVDALSDSTFYSVTKHDPRETTDVEKGQLKGQITEGIGYTLGETPSVNAVLVFEDGGSVGKETVFEWADARLPTVSEPTVSTDGNAITITGDVDTLGYTNIAFYPFQFADGSARSNLS